MGAWGSALYANDTTCDVRDSYKKYLLENMGNMEAYERTLEEYKECIGDNEEEPLLWYALADTQWRMGRLLPEVKKKALLWIGQKGGYSLWEESKNGGAGWKKTLEKLEEKLNKPQPPEKKIKKPSSYTRNPWNVGDLYAYQINTDVAKENGIYGKYIVLQKIGNAEWCDGLIFSLIQVYDRLFDYIPVCRELEGVRILPLIESSVKELKKTETEKSYNMYFERFLIAQMVYLNKKEYSEKNFCFIGNKPCPEIDYKCNQYSEWYWEKRKIDYIGEVFYKEWQGEEY